MPKGDNLKGKGDLQAIKLLIDVFGWNAPSKQEQTIIEKRIVDDLFIEE